MSHEDTVGTITFDGVTYEIDWPRDLDGHDRLADLGVVYLNGQQLAEFCDPTWEPFISVEHLMRVAYEFISGGGLE